MRFDQVAEFAFSLWASGNTETSLTLLGPPGIGKSSIALDVAQRMTTHATNALGMPMEAICEIVDLSSRMPEDVGGLPFRDKQGEQGVVSYDPQRWLARLCRVDAFGVLLLDDLPAAAPSVQVAVRQLVLDRRVNDSKLSDGVLILVTGNRREDKSNASSLPAHFRNSTCLLEVEPHYDGWASWYGKQAGCDPVISSFLRYRSAHFHKLPKDADTRGAFATPRTWAKLGRMYKTAVSCGTLFETSRGLVGEGVATEFTAFVNTKNQLVSPLDVLKDPEGAMPDPRRMLDAPDKAYAMVTGLAEVTGAELSEHIKAGKAAALLETSTAYLIALAHVCVGNEEYIGASFNTVSSLNPKGLMPIVQAARRAENDPRVKSVLRFIHRVTEGR